MEATAVQRHASGGPGAEPVAENFPKAFQATVARLGDANAIRDGERTLSWIELRGRPAPSPAGSPSSASARATR